MDLQLELAPGIFNKGGINKGSIHMLLTFPVIPLSHYSPKQIAKNILIEDMCGRALP